MVMAFWAVMEARGLRPHLSNVTLFLGESEIVAVDDDGKLLALNARSVSSDIVVFG